MDLVGQKIGNYRILSLLGRGGTAEVYKAFHPATKRDVAVKVLLQEVSQDLDWVRRFRQEVELLGKLDHPHILPIYDAGEHDGRPFLVMKYMGDGTTLRSQLTGQPWPLNRVVKVVKQVADALDAAHKAGVVHRDIKPSNILVTPELKCLVFDFGIAKPFRRDEITTGSNDVVGTPEFMSPEQCKGEKVDHRSDVYSLGVMTYQLLTGHVPFTAETAVGILMKHLTEPLPIPPRGVALPPAVNGVLRKAMAREPSERFATAGELSASFERSADQKATVTLHAADIRRAAIPTLKLPGWVRHLRRPKARLAAASVIVAMLLGVTYALWPQAETGTLATREVTVGDTAGDGAAGSAAAGMTLPADGNALQSSDVATARGPVALSASPARTPAESSSNDVPTSPSSAAQTATLRIQTSERANVLLDGQHVGVAPGDFGSVSPGKHLVTLDAGPGRVQEQAVVATAGSTHVVRFDFNTASDGAQGGKQGNVEGTSTGKASRAGVSNPSASDRSPGSTQLAPPNIKRWAGYLTDEDCGATGGRQGDLHLRCAERCIREGKQPMLYSRGRLYRLNGIEKLTPTRGEPLLFEGWLEVDTIHVTSSRVDPE